MTFEKQQEVIASIRTELTANPFTFGAITIDEIFRNGDRGKPQKNFLTIGYANIDTAHGHQCPTNKMLFYIDAYYQNELVSTRVISKIVENFYNFEYNATRDKLIGVEHTGGTIEISKGLFNSRAKFYVYI